MTRPNQENHLSTKNSEAISVIFQNHDCNYFQAITALTTFSKEFEIRFKIIPSMQRRDKLW